MPIQSISFGVTGAALAVLWLALGAALFLAVWAYRAPEPPLGRAVRTTLALLRFAALALLLTTLFQPVITMRGSGGVRPVVPVLVDVSGSMALPRAHAAGDTLSRFAGALETLDHLLPALGSGVEVRLFAFGDQVEEVSRERLARITPQGGATRLGPALTEILGRRLPPGTPLCLVLSDGGVNAGSDPLGAGRAQGVPIITVPVSNDSVLIDVWISEVRSNRRAFLEQETPVVVRLASRLPTESAARVVLTDGDRVVAGRNVRLSAGESELEVTLAVTPERLGSHHYRIDVEPIQGEVSDANNHRALALEVMEEQAQVLLVAGALSWDVTFLRRALDDDRTLATTLLARLAPRGEYRAVGRGKLTRLPDSGQDLRPFGAVVLAGVDLATWPGPARVALADYLRGGGGLVVLAGGEPEALRSLATGELEGLMPVRLTAGPPLGLVSPDLTAPGLAHAVTALGESPGRASARWSELPPVHATLRVEAALGAEVLVEGEGIGGRAPLVIAGVSGRGRTLVTVATEVWRWDFLGRERGTGDGLAASFWGEAVRWVAAGHRGGDLEIFADKSVFLGGEPATLGARLTDRRLKPVDDARVTAELAPVAGGDTLRVELLPGESPGHYLGDAGLLAAGIYELRGFGRSGEEVWHAGAVPLVVDRATLDGATAAADPGRLRRLAAATGGGVLDPTAGFDGLAGLVDASRERLAAFEIKLWNHPVLFAVFVSVLTLEWLLRRRRGLA